MRGRADDPRRAYKSLQPAWVRGSFCRGHAIQPGAGRENQALVTAAKPPLRQDSHVASAHASSRS